ncbi:MAG TPA: SH3 domain-containing protein [Kofleriaceae bacterium]|nr:SH3 domain-containing protein [Kofleriaceae bacterium]
MRVVALILLAFGLLVGIGGSADAEKVKTNQSTKVYARPGEQAKVIVTVKSGQNMTLLAKDGRWLKVRVNGRTGYVPRSKVDMADDDEIARNTRRRPFVDGRGRRRGFGGDAPDDRVAADATGDGADSGDDEEEDEEEDEPAKKPVKTAAKSNAKKGGDEDEEEEEDEEDEKPVKKAPVKVAVKATEKKTPAKKGGDEDEEDEEDEEPAKTAAKAGGDDEEEDEETPTKGGDEEEKADTRPVARVGKKVAVYEKPNLDSNEAFVVRPSDLLYPSDEKNGWTFVENSEGDSGWIESTELSMEGGGGGGGMKKTIDVRARFGLMFLQQGVRTQGSTNLNVPDNYNIGTSSIAMAVGAGILIPKGKKLLLGGEFTYDYAKTLLGGVFYDADGKGGSPGVNIGVTIHNINARGMVGIDLKKKSGMAVFGRLGYRYQGFLITDVASMTANPAKLPSEVVKAPTIGAALAIPKLSEKLGLRLSLDAIAFGASVKQTVGLEDGSAPSVKAVDVGAGLTYKFKKAFDIQAAYDLQYMGIDFGPPLMSSTRGHMGTRTTRTDFFHVVTVGITKPF